jgi:hypothetical protein
MRRLLPLLLHSTCVLLYGYTIYFDYKAVSDLERSGKYRYPIPGLHFSKLVWLTVINLYVQFIYHCIGAVLSLSAPSAEKAATPTRESAVRREFHFFSTTLIFPIAITVVVLFWSLYFINPKLVMDEQGKRILAISWFNHAIHTVPAAVMITDHVLWSHPRQTSSRTVLVTVISFACLYIALVHFVWFFWNFWAYPILGELIPPLRILFIIFCSLFMYAAYLIGDSILRLRQWFDTQPVMKTE